MREIDEFPSYEQQQRDDKHSVIAEEASPILSDFEAAMQALSGAENTRQQNRSANRRSRGLSVFSSAQPTLPSSSSSASSLVNDRELREIKSGSMSMSASLSQPHRASIFSSLPVRPLLFGDDINESAVLQPFHVLASRRQWLQSLSCAEADVELMERLILFDFLEFKHES